MSSILLNLVLSVAQGAKDYSNITQTAWHDWLLARYGSVAALNAAWGTVFWSHTYNSWAEVPLPWNTLGGSYNPGLALDYSRFVHSSAVSFLQLQVAALRAAAPTKAITHNCMGQYNGVDYSAFGALLDFVAWDNYPTGGFGVWPNASDAMIYSAAFSAAIMRGAKSQQPFFIMEQQASSTGQFVYYGSTFPELTRLLAWQQVANGADGLQFFRWRTTRVGFEQHWEGVLDWDGSLDNAKYPSVVRLGAEFRLVSPHVAGARVPARVAVLLSPDTRWALGIEPVTTPTLALESQMQALLAAFRRRQQAVDVVFVPTGGQLHSTDLANYSIVLAPTLWVVPDELPATLSEFVSRGGQLLLTMRSGSKTATNAYTNHTLPGLLAPLAGITVAEWDVMCSLGEDALATRDGRRFPISSTRGRICEVLRPASGTETLATYAGGYHAGRTVVSRHAVGSAGGSVVYSGAISDDPAYHGWLAEQLATGARLPLGPPLPTGVEVAVRTLPSQVVASAQGGGLRGDSGQDAATTSRTVFVLNYNFVAVTVTVPAAAGGYDLLTGTTIGADGQVTVPAHDLFVVAV